MPSIFLLFVLHLKLQSALSAEPQRAPQRIAFAWLVPIDIHAYYYYYYYYYYYQYYVLLSPCTDDIYNPFFPLGKPFSSPAIDACVFLESLAVADKEEAALFYQKLAPVKNSLSLPPNFLRNKHLPFL